LKFQNENTHKDLIEKTTFDPTIKGGQHYGFNKNFLIANNILVDFNLCYGLYKIYQLNIKKT